MKKEVFILFLFVLLISSCSYFIPGNLGNNLYLMEGEKTSDRIIVLCAGKDNLFGCYSGACIIPPNKYLLNEEKQKIEKYYSEYVNKVKSGRKYVLVKTYNYYDNKNNYWIIDKNFDENIVTAETIISNYLIGPVDLTQFYQLLEEKDIDLKFNN